ncbi:MAG: NAD-dependent epimerase/dehydratase family protein [Thiotrichaceae bacterium]|nr:NAD-dependent epimerase/dehydratase family protein [Thiotrichaceae bacterium]
MNSPQIKSVTIIGCGRVGQRLAKLYQKQGIQTSATVSSMESYHQIKRLCTAAFLMNIDQPLSASLPSTDLNRLFYFVPPPSKGRKDPRIARFLKKYGTQIKQIVLISTSGVYGDCQGQWIDEQQVLNPTADRAYRRLDAEHEVKQWAKQTMGKYSILRVAGIYSKEQLPIERIRQGMQVVNNAESPWVNRIQADDLAMICYQAMKATGLSGEVFNVSDGHPSTMTEYFHHIADYASLERPTEISLAEAEKCLSKGMLSYLHESRRMKNDKLVEKLKIELKYPSLVEGLKI